MDDCFPVHVVACVLDGHPEGPVTVVTRIWDSSKVEHCRLCPECVALPMASPFGLSVCCLPVLGSFTAKEAVMIQTESSAILVSSERV